MHPVRLGGLDPDTEEPGDFLRGPTFGHEVQDLPLARGEMLRRLARTAQVRIDDRLAHARTEEDRTRLDVAYGADQICSGLRLQHEASDARAEALEHVLVVGVHRQ